MTLVSGCGEWLSMEESGLDSNLFDVLVMLLDGRRLQNLSKTPGGLAKSRLIGPFVDFRSPEKMKTKRKGHTPTRRVPT